MNRKELIRRVTNVMRDNHIKKPVYAQRQVLHISDDDGNTKDFVIKKNDTGVLFTADDVENIIDACIYVIEDAIKHGDSVTVRGFGTLGLNYRKARVNKHPVTGEVVDVGARYVPKFVSGNDLKMCAKVYELSIGEKLCELPPLDDVDEDGDELGD